jgi:hypothetical protein
MLLELPNGELFSNSFLRETFYRKATLFQIVVVVCNKTTLLFFVGKEDNVKEK